MAGPVLHLRAQRGWTSDPNAPCLVNGVYHVFYQHNPNGPDWASMHWGHASSRDLVSWTAEPLALQPQIAHDGEHHCFSGSSCVTDAAGRPVIWYTSCEGGADALPRKQAAVVGSADLRHWRWYGHNVIQPVPEFDTDWRDPFVWQVPGTQRWYMLLGVRARRPPHAPSVVVFSAASCLGPWTRCGVALTQDDEPDQRASFFECPSIGSLPGLPSSPPGSSSAPMFQVLVTSLDYGNFSHGPVRWHIGSLRLPTTATAADAGTRDRRCFFPLLRGVLDAGPAAYASARLDASAGRVAFLSWVKAIVPGRAAGWNGCVSFPRRTCYDAARRTLLQYPWPDLVLLRSRWLHQPMLPVCGTVAPAPGWPGTCEMLWTVHRAAAPVCIRLGDAISFTVDLSTATVTIAVHDQDKHTARIALSSPAPVTLHAFLDRCVLEVFLDDGAAVATLAHRLPLSSTGAVAVDTRADATSLVTCSAYQLAPLPSPARL